MERLSVEATASAQPIALGVSKARVVVTHPGKQHAHQVVLAAQQAGMLQRFVTSFYWRDQDLLTRVTRRISKSRSLEIRYLRRRWNPDIDPALVSTFAKYHLAARLLASLLARTLGSHAPDVNRWADALYDREVAGWLRHQPSPTVVHAFEGAALKTLKAARQLGIRTILDVPSAYERLINEINVERRRHGFSRVRFSRRLSAERNYADILLVASEYVAQFLTEQGVSRNRIAIVPYGVDAQRFSPREQTSETRPFRVLYVGRVALHKGIEYLLEAWRMASLKESELVIAGGIDPSVLHLIKSRPSNTRCVGQVALSRVPGLYKSADVFVLPSLSDGFGMVILEAMASGIPVIATSSCGAPVRDGIDGYVVPIRNARAIAERLDILYRNPELRSQMGAAGRQHVISRYSWQRYRLRVAATYSALTNGQLVTEAVERPLES